jgi:hypothetical protein
MGVEGALPDAKGRGQGMMRRLAEPASFELTAFTYGGPLAELSAKRSRARTDQ